VAPGATCCEWRFPGVAPHVTREQTAARRAELGLSPEDRTVVYSGTFEPYQGLPLLIEAAALVARTEPSSRFVLVGGDPRAARELEQQARRLGIDGRVRLVPRQPRERVWSYLSVADVTVSPRSHGDNLPLKILDYMSIGKPIVATAITAHTAALDEECAELVPPTPAGLAMGIQRLLHDPARARDIARAAMRRAQTDLGWDRFVRQVDEAVRFLTCENAPPPA
jgi:glycosyltransferase involved in cell wall biosynthesis